MVDASNAVDDILGTSTSGATKKPAKTGKPSAAKKAAAKPTKAVVTKPAKVAAVTPAKSGKKSPAVAATAKVPKAVKPAGDVSTTQPEDKIVLAAVKKLKAPALASELATGLGVHRRVIRSQLQRLAKDKANGVVMKKDGFNWYVSSKA